MAGEDRPGELAPHPMVDGALGDRPQFGGAGWAVAILAVALLVGIVTVVRSHRTEPHATQELDAALSAIGVPPDGPEVTYGTILTISLDASAPECNDAGEHPRSQQQTLFVRQQGRSPEQIIDALVAHYGDTGASTRLYEPDGTAEIANVFQAVDYGRHRFLMAFVNHDGTFDLRGASSPCSMAPYDGPPNTEGWIEVPIDG